MTLTISPPSPPFIPPPIHTSSQMNLTLSISLTAKPSTFSCFHSKTPTPLRIKSTAFRASSSRTIPARDRSIDFGKYKGRMLGTLPSTYLKWISKNLRARDFEEWAKMADEVLIDPVYKDRIEWEFAEKVLNGDVLTTSSNPTGDSVSELLEISERFGWDNEDKIGWSKIDFGLLGTSKSGRIPRVKAEKSRVEFGDLKKKENIDSVDFEEDERRRERRERMRQRRTSSAAVGTTTKSMSDEGQEQKRGEDGAVFLAPRPSPFPGREALLNKARNRQRLF
ncbi:hypothetical protein ACJIZ3_010090 [Penstemon smallii]|uniref:Uncharacterized protein n=1 Tax=Penstemon smallii TaxID=265156 RepID=A0ABD3TEE0_9LAMI